MTNPYPIYLENIDGQTFRLPDGTTTVRVFIGCPPKAGPVVTDPNRNKAGARIKRAVVLPAYADAPGLTNEFDVLSDEANFEALSDDAGARSTTYPAGEESP